MRSGRSARRLAWLPVWIGIGAQRSGTTWFTDLLTSHPDVSLVSDKELHYFDRFAAAPFSDGDAATYRAMFTTPGSGEFTPGYLRWPWIAPLLREACPDALLLVLLRDPVDRFVSALRWYERVGQGPNLDLGSRTQLNLVMSDAAWGGLYAAQLDVWSEVFPIEQIHVEQYERAAADPQRAAEAFWDRLGLAAVKLPETRRPSRTSTTHNLRWQHLADSARRLYAPQLDALSSWGVDLSLWPSATA